MFSFFMPRNRWKWDEEGPPSKKVLKIQRQTLNSTNKEEKKRLLEHLADLANRGAEFRRTLCEAKVTADVCKCFLTDAPAIQSSASRALVALCDMNPDNCAATLAAHNPLAPRGEQQVAPHAVKLLQSYGKDVHLAIDAVKLLQTLCTYEAGAVAHTLLQSGGLAAVQSVLQGCSTAALSDSMPAAKCRPLLLLLEQTLQMLQSAATGDAALCRELGKDASVKLLLELTQNHRGQNFVEGSDDGHGDHRAVISQALRLLRLVLSQVPAQRVMLLENDGIRRVLAVLRDLQLPWSVRLNAVAVLQEVSASPTVADEVVRGKGLDTSFAFMSQMVGKPAGGGAMVTPPRGAAPPPDTLWNSPPRAEGGVGMPEPRGVIVVEKLLGLVGVLAASIDPSLLLAPDKVEMLMAVFNRGMGNFPAGGYKLTVGCAQVLLRLARHQGQQPPAALCGPSVTDPLTALLVRGAQDFPAVADAMQAQVVHGAWCAAGLLCQIINAEYSRSRTLAALSINALGTAVRLLDTTTAVVLTAVGAGRLVSGAAVPYLCMGRVMEDFKTSVTALMDLLVALAEDVANRPALQNMGAPQAAKNLMPWQQGQWRTKRLLHLMGELDAEYKPFLRYSGPLLAALLSSQGIDPAPFMSRGVDAPILLGLEDGYLRGTLGLDEVVIMKVGRIRAAYKLFSTIDGMDGGIDGCVSAADVDRYLVEHCNMQAPSAATGDGKKRKETGTAADVRDRMFGELQVLPGEPICFMQFINCYPWLEEELSACAGQARQGSGLSPIGQAAGQGYGARAFKRQRVGDAGGNTGAGGSAAAAGMGPAGQGRGLNYIELE